MINQSESQLRIEDAARAAQQLLPRGTKIVLIATLPVSDGISEINFITNLTARDAMHAMVEMSLRVAKELHEETDKKPEADGA